LASQDWTGWMQRIPGPDRFLSKSERDFDLEQRKVEIEFKFDVFVSYAMEDRVTALDIAQTLRSEGLQVWFNEWQLDSDEDVLNETEYGLEHSRVMVLCTSAAAFSSSWPTLEAGILRFRDPLNKKRRFVSVRLDDAQPPPTLAQIEPLDWIREDHETVVAKLLRACRAGEPSNDVQDQRENQLTKSIHLNYKYNEVRHFAFSADGKHALVGGTQQIVDLWDLERGQCLKSFTGHNGTIRFLAWSADNRFALSASDDKTIRVWHVETGRPLYLFAGHDGPVLSVAWSSDNRRVLSCSRDKSVRLWNLRSTEVGRFLSH
jgi:WD40 repeat protein